MGAKMLIHICPDTKADLAEIDRRLQLLADDALNAPGICDRHGDAHLPDGYDELPEAEQRQAFARSLRQELLSAATDLTNPARGDIGGFCAEGRDYLCVAGMSWGDDVHELARYIDTIGDLGLFDDFDPRWISKSDPSRLATSWLFSCVGHFVEYHALPATLELQGADLVLTVAEPVDLEDTHIPAGCWRIRTRPAGSTPARPATVNDTATQQPEPEEIEHLVLWAITVGACDRKDAVGQAKDAMDSGECNTFVVADTRDGIPDDVTRALRGSPPFRIIDLDQDGDPTCP